MLFRDRADAGRHLAERLWDYAGRADVLILALPRGGVPVGAEVARALGAPFDVFLVRKLGVPGHEELAMGAIASGGVRVLNDHVITALGIPAADIEAVSAAEERELERRELLYRGGRPLPSLAQRTIILIDDGLATGTSMRAAVAALRQHRPDRIIVAVPVGSADTCSALSEEADEVICLYTPEPFAAVGWWYRNFEQTTDEEVRQALANEGRLP
jgi:predicted phosphoribosyltransferase